MEGDEIKKIVREKYGEIASGGGCGCGSSSCCDSTESLASSIGYSAQDLQAAPQAANLGLGCGNPVAMLSLNEGDTVVDLGSGAGFDCFLAAQKVGLNGRVVGVDMTPQMIDRARQNAKQGNYANVEFRLGEIENLPVADKFASAVISNCVINLSPDKARVFREAFRVLRPGGRLLVSDIVLSKPLPEAIRNSQAAYAECVAGAMLQADYVSAIEQAGFVNVKVLAQTFYPAAEIVQESVARQAGNLPVAVQQIMTELENTISSITIQAEKPA